LCFGLTVERQTERSLIYSTVAVIYSTYRNVLENCAFYRTVYLQNSCYSVNKRFYVAKQNEEQGSTVFTLR